MQFQVWSVPMNNASRRSFLSTALGAAAMTPAMAAGGGAASTTDNTPGFKLGVASYSFREFSRHLAIVNTKKLGINYINIKEFHLPLNSTMEEIAKARAEFEKAGLTILGGGNV